jgi:hypothetical protein
MILDVDREPACRQGAGGPVPAGRAESSLGVVGVRSAAGRDQTSRTRFFHPVAHGGFWTNPQPLGGLDLVRLVKREIARFTSVIVMTSRKAFDARGAGVPGGGERCRAQDPGLGAPTCASACSTPTRGDEGRRPKREKLALGGGRGPRGPSCIR